MSFVKLSYDLLLCVCVIVMVHLFFQSGGGRERTNEEQVVEVMVSGLKIHWPWEVALVGKTLYWFLSVVLLSMVVMKIS